VVHTVAALVLMHGHPPRYFTLRVNPEAVDSIFASRHRPCPFLKFHLRNHYRPGLLSSFKDGSSQVSLVYIRDVIVLKIKVHVHGVCHICRGGQM
jgi:hypothetical protein